MHESWKVNVSVSAQLVPMCCTPAGIKLVNSCNSGRNGNYEAFDAREPCRFVPRYQRTARSNNGYRQCGMRRTDEEIADSRQHGPTMRHLSRLNDGTGLFGLACSFSFLDVAADLLRPRVKIFHSLLMLYGLVFERLE